MIESRCTFYGGKGGVGKTTAAAANALAWADRGERTLVVSSDPAHSLSDAFETSLGPEPREVTTHCWAVEVDADARKVRFERIAKAMAADLRAAGVSLSDEAVEHIFGAGAPAGADELAVLDLLVEYVDTGEWDRIVFDTAPTGHTLRLFDLPEVMGRTLETLVSLRGQVRRIGDTAKRAMLGPVYYATGTSDEGEELVDLQARLERARAILTDPELTTFRVVLLPETMVIAESERLVQHLAEVGVDVSTVVVNRVLEAERADKDCSRCSDTVRRHANRVNEIQRTFPDQEVVVLPDLDGESGGLETLASIGERLYGVPDDA